MKELLSNPAVVALVAGVPSLVVAWFSYRQAMKLDQRAEAELYHGAIQAVIERQNAMIDRLQKELEEKEKQT